MATVQLNYDYLLKIYTKSIANDRLLSIDIILTDIYDLDTFELWYTNNTKKILRLKSATGETHYINREEITHVVSKKVHFDGKEYI
jgi:hypothetical protein